MITVHRKETRFEIVLAIIAGVSLGWACIISLFIDTQVKFPATILEFSFWVSALAFVFSFLSFTIYIMNKDREYAGSVEGLLERIKVAKSETDKAVQKLSELGYDYDSAGQLQEYHN